ncbi:MAG: cysteine peptidase family C39 domain-containing protein [Candidatus Woesearchaeota archaeon]
MLKIKPFRQKSGFCGPASLKIVLKYYGIRKREKELAKLCGCLAEGIVPKQSMVIQSTGTQEAIAQKLIAAASGPNVPLIASSSSVACESKTPNKAKHAQQEADAISTPNIELSKEAEEKALKHVSSKGVEAEELLKVAKALGMKGSIRDNSNIEDIRMHVHKRKIPVIVDWFSKDDGHYSVVVDVDQENIYLQDPELGYVRAMRLFDFNRVWFDFLGDSMQSKDDLILRRMIVLHK